MPSSQPPSSSRITSTRRLVALATTLMLAGIAVTVIHTGSESVDDALPVFGQVLAALSFAGLVWGLHRLGRLGPEPGVAPTGGSESGSDAGSGSAP
jgi:hypothetical protein